jgi:signal transduction histidine kinase
MRVMYAALRPLIAEPADLSAPRRVWRDWALLAVFVPASIIEALLRTDLHWRWFELLLALAMLPTLLWRRTHPLAMVVLDFGTMFALAGVQVAFGLAKSPGLYTMAILLLSLYALFRWASGRHIAIGAPIVLTTATVCIIADKSNLSDVIGGYTVVGIAAAVGAAVRFRARARQREMEQVRLHERGELARDLHDTVAHHVSAMAIRAQAGMELAPTDPTAAVDALRVIATEASRTLAEMRAMVGVLRRNEPAVLAPLPVMDDLYRLAETQGPTGPGTATVTVNLADGIGSISPASGAAIFRIAQESVTNARRHAHLARRITVDVTGNRDSVRLVVADDGQHSSDRFDSAGFGVAGMLERAQLLGGTCTAGPGPGTGWIVAAVLPRHPGST